MDRELPRDDVILLLLAILNEGPHASAAIGDEIRRRAGAAFRLPDGGTGAAIRRLEIDGKIVGMWMMMPRGSAHKVYTLTPAGRDELEERAEAWRRYARRVEAILETARGE